MAHSVTWGPLAGSCTTKPKQPVSLSLTVRYILNKGINMETFKSTVFSPIPSTSATESRPAGWAMQAIWQKKTPWSLQGEEFEAEYWTTCTVFQGAESFGPLHRPISCCVFSSRPWVLTTTCGFTPQSHSLSTACLWLCSAESVCVERELHLPNTNTATEASLFGTRQLLCIF